MGVNLAPIVNKHELNLERLRGRSFAVDAFNVMHQFLALIRSRDGKPLTDPDGEVTSHLVGLAYRSTKLISDYGMKLVFIFDGKPPDLKMNVIRERKEAKIKAREEYKMALEEGDMAKAWSKAVQTGRLSPEGISDAKKFLTLSGIPWIQAPSEGEAQAAYMADRGAVWAVNSRDYDSLIFGAPRLVRYLTIQGKIWLPSKGEARKLQPELMILEENLGKLGINRRQLVDVCILIGTDYNSGIKGIGPKTALKIIKKHGSLEKLPSEIRDELPGDLEKIREIYLNPEVKTEYEIEANPPEEDKLSHFLIEEKGFSPDRVDKIIHRLNQARVQKTLKKWVDS